MTEVVIIALMLTVECQGHTNAQCWPVITEFPSIEACEKARTKTGLFGNETKDGWSVCFKSVK